MVKSNRRNFIKTATAGIAMTGAGGIMGSINKALAVPANNATKSIMDVEHIIFVMQENRSFDHYFGTLQGVRGFNDPRAVKLTKTTNVFQQPYNGSYLMPYRPDIDDLGSTFLADTPHGWADTHDMWNQGFWDGWPTHKGQNCMIHMQRSDIPYHIGLADAFTICDDYHCGILSSTHPNRSYWFSGCVGNVDGKTPNLDGTGSSGLAWKCYAERLTDAGVSWGLYQDAGAGIGWNNGTFGVGFPNNNPLQGNWGNIQFLFHDGVQNAATTSTLYQNACRATNIAQNGGSLFDLFRQDVENGNLPSVSWFAAPEAYSEHPNWIPPYGAWYLSQIVDILADNPDVWSKTAIFVTYDENDGFFDHVVSPTPPTQPGWGKSTVSIENEIFPGSDTNRAGPYGVGPRVPMLVISPWTRGGRVNSQLFDHTSGIRFVESRFMNDPSVPNPSALYETNITPWRRAVCGDLTSVFDFQNPNENVTFNLPDTSSDAPASSSRYSDVTPTPPGVQALPVQETGTRVACALPYDLHVQCTPSGSNGMIALEFINSGEQGAVFHVRDIAHTTPPRYFTVGAQQTLSDEWVTDAAGDYHLEIHGPNGFFRQFTGSAGSSPSLASVGMVTRSNRAAQSLILQLVNHGTSALKLAFADGYKKINLPAVSIAAQGTHALVIPASGNSGWYDITMTSAADSTFALQIAGHLENGSASITDPLMGGQVS
ncbi:phospholipase C, phosphocholine-specific [Gluconobacter sp. Dm-62]|uniref:phosphocholine-specific phospholipase C n=1 Tax=Gluconobacter sp. Dm-62 TaxID=2799804 RepID=UPI001B8AE430|nr:phospholipase C, phosphocholine-specific [Gluconobacter sp. Dm-62]MBS1103333.1 phospholipase C, phosphocholine-specific [Gluconobacter sp. Dm-62]